MILNPVHDKAGSAGGSGIAEQGPPSNSLPLAALPSCGSLFHLPSLQQLTSMPSRELPVPLGDSPLP